MNFGFASAVVLAVLGIAAGVAVGHRGSDASGVVRIVPAGASTDAAPQRTVEGWLADTPLNWPSAPIRQSPGRITPIP